MEIWNYHRLFTTKIAGVLFVIWCRHIEEPMMLSLEERAEER
jgi:hypothetical protein